MISFAKYTEIFLLLVYLCTCIIKLTYNLFKFFIAQIEIQPSRNVEIELKIPKYISVCVCVWIFALSVNKLNWTRIFINLFTIALWKYWNGAAEFPTEQSHENIYISQFLLLFNTCTRNYLICETAYLFIYLFILHAISLGLSKRGQYFNHLKLIQTDRR